MSFFTAFQSVLPQHLLSAVVGIAGRSTLAPVKKILIEAWIKRYHVNLDEAARGGSEDYSSFVDFFTRELKDAARPVDRDPQSIVSPVDGTVSQAGDIESGMLFQAKGHKFSLDHLVGENAKQLNGGQFATIYLAPRDYHRVHAPITAQISRSTQIPGKLFSVNATTESAITDLFCQNERLVIWLDTDHGSMALIMIAALIVAGIETTFSTPDSPYRKLTRSRYVDLAVDKGNELGRFTLGSTVILALPTTMGQLNALEAGQTLRFGESIGAMRDRPEM